MQLSIQSLTGYWIRDCGLPFSSRDWERERGIAGNRTHGDGSRERERERNRRNRTHGETSLGEKNLWGLGGGETDRERRTNGGSEAARRIRRDEPMRARRRRDGWWESGTYGDGEAERIIGTKRKLKGESRGGEKHRERWEWSRREIESLSPSREMSREMEWEMKKMTLGGDNPNFFFPSRATRGCKDADENF